jgi:hypothetical protein
MEPNDIDAFFRFIEARSLSGPWITRTVVDSLPRGAIVGVVDIVGCVRTATSPWFEGPYGFVLANPQAITPIPFRGAQKFFELPSDVLATLTALMIELDKAKPA